MAAADSSLATDQYSCPVCREVLKEPVTIPCGHSYCLDCIDDYWDKSDTKETYNCHQCRRSFKVRPELNKNVLLDEVIKSLKEVKTDVTHSQSYAGPDDATCDLCPEKKLRAVKTCLTCMASYCETHLQPHRKYEALKRHKLEEPTRNLEEKLCARHQRVLEVFCRTDGACICLLCLATEHKNHDTVTPDEERAGRQNQLEVRKAEMKNKIEEKEKKLKEMKETVMMIQFLFSSNQSAAERELQELEETFKSVLQAIEKLRSEVIAVISSQKRMVVRKAEEVMERLEKEIKDLKRKDVELAELSQTEDHIRFLKKLPSLCVPVEGRDAPNTTAKREFLSESLKKKLCHLKKILVEMSGWEFVKAKEAGVNDSGHILQNLRTRNGLLKYSCPLTLDPNTVHRRLRLSEGERKVTTEMTEVPYPDHPDRFDFWLQVLCREALSGNRWYWEVEWSGEGVTVGVTYKGITRKGDKEEYRLGYDDKSWNLFCSDSSYTAWHNTIKTEIIAPCSHRIGIYLDCPAGTLSFYSILDTMTLLHMFNTSFTEPLYLGFGFKFHSSVRICPLTLSDW
ncbi:tripartite motif-containing protein 16-like [Erpetoichthys calabaricus]|uniref:tripartite motif-containing protein 16-like n=1 Tax=Erpetoichthys calabaricus TaxID=27687 RepID=UPI002234389A|nr:tripartite motif-containing protein 16-like [Erpetoichthys calabaricus]